MPTTTQAGLAIMNFRQASSSHRNEPPSVNLTPLIDVVFILLIFFLLTTTFRHAAGLNVNLPRATTTQTQNAGNQKILSLDRQGDLFLDREKLSQAEALKRLQALQDEGSSSLIILQADEDVPHGKVVRVLDELRNAGLNQIAIGARPQANP